MEFEVTNETQREQAMTRMVQRGATIANATDASIPTNFFISDLPV